MFQKFWGIMRREGDRETETEREQTHLLHPVGKSSLEFIFNRVVDYV